MYTAVDPLSSRIPSGNAKRAPSSPLTSINPGRRNPFTVKPRDSDGPGTGQVVQYRVHRCACYRASSPLPARRPEPVARFGNHLGAGDLGSYPNQADRYAGDPPSAHTQRTTSVAQSTRHSTAIVSRIPGFAHQNRPRPLSQINLIHPRDIRNLQFRHHGSNCHTNETTILWVEKSR